MKELEKALICLIALTLLCGCQKPIETILIVGYRQNKFTGREGPEIWIVGKVLEKHGDMWKIKVDGRVHWVDITEAEWRRF